MIDRRTFITALAVAPLGAADKRFQGIFPILQTPYTQSGALDTEALAREVKFLDIVQGIVWPQLASEWSDLSADERFAGAEAIIAAARGTRPAVVLGVQGPDIESAVRYARHADKLAPDAIIALPPRDSSDLDRVAAYYRAIAKACARPLFVQTIGNMSVEFVLRMSREIASLRFVKDEAGHTLSRISEYRRAAPELGVFTGAHGRTLLDEASRGAAGSMPAASFADLYVEVWKLFASGKRRQAMERFAGVSLLVNQVQAYGLESLKYILHLRGVFPNWRCRGVAAGRFDAQAERAVRESFEFAIQRKG